MSDQAIRDEAIAALKAHAWTEPRRQEDYERAVDAVLSLTRDADGNDIAPEAQIPVGEISRVIHEALGEQRVLIHCISQHGFGADWRLGAAVEAVQSAQNLEWVTGFAHHNLRVTDQEGKRWLFDACKPEPSPCQCSCSCWSKGVDGLCDACRMNIHSGDRPRPYPVAVTCKGSEEAQGA